MPWKQVGEGTLLLAARQLDVTYSSIENSSRGLTSSGFVIDDLDAQSSMGMVKVSISFKNLTVIPDIAASLLNMAPTCRLSFTGCVLGDIPVLRMKIPGVSLGNGRVTVSYNRGEIFLEELRCDGELSMNGSLVLVPSAERLIRWADVEMNVKSEPFEKELPSLQNLLPLQQNSPGRWVLHRSVGDTE
jgi:hypothetical protein